MWTIVCLAVQKLLFIWMLSYCLYLGKINRLLSRHTSLDKCHGVCKQGIMLILVSERGLFLINLFFSFTMRWSGYANIIIPTITLIANKKKTISSNHSLQV